MLGAMKPLPVVLGALVLAHVVFGLLRVPHVVVGRRLLEIADYRREGDAAYVLRTAFLRGADAIAALRRATPADAVIGYRGGQKGALEFAPALLWPRLCCNAAALPAGASTAHGRPIAAQVLVGDGATLRLEPR